MKAIVYLLLTLMISSGCGCVPKEGHTGQSINSASETSITLTPSSSAYDLSKVAQGNVRFLASIRNEGAETATIAHPSMCLPDSSKPGQARHFKDNHGKSEILLKITKPDGTIVVLRDGWMHGFDPGNVHHLTISPGGTASFDLGWFFLNARGRWEDDAEAATVFLGKGTYKVSLIFRNAFPWAFIFKNSDKPDIQQVWTGEMRSQEVAIEIR